MEGGQGFDNGAGAEEIQEVYHELDSYKSKMASVDQRMQQVELALKRGDIGNYRSHLTDARVVNNPSQPLLHKDDAS